MNAHLSPLALAAAVVVAGCGQAPTAPTTATLPTNAPATVLEETLKQEYAQIFHEEIDHPAIFNGFSASCGGDHMSTTAYLKSPTPHHSRLLTLYTSSDGHLVKKSTNGTVLTPAGTIHVLVILVKYPETIGGDALGLWESAQSQINEDHAAFARARGYASPIVTFENTNLVIDRSQIADPHDLLSIRSTLLQQGRTTDGFDLVASVNIDPTLLEGGFSNVVSSVQGFIYMGNYLKWSTPLGAGDFASIARSVYHHEVAHHWGWPATHDWTTCTSKVDFGFNFLIPPSLFGWEDVDGDGVPEILDNTPYGRPHS